MVDAGFGGATGAKDVVSARIAQVRRVLMFLLLVAHRSVADAVLGCFCLLCCCKANDVVQDSKAAVRIDTGARQWLVWLCFGAVGLVQS